jgi:hypothetical protein
VSSHAQHLVDFKEDFMKRLRQTLKIISETVLAISVVSIGLQAATPKGWFVAGSRPAEYESGVDVSAVHNYHPSAYLKATHPIIQGFGTLMQQITANYYLGKRVRFSALVKTEDAQDWAGLWMRVDKGSQAVAFDNMQNRAIKGTSEWRRYDIVLDVPADATGISFGVLLSGSGEVWLNDARVEVVGATVLPTSGEIHAVSDEPTNLDFRE